MRGCESPNSRCGMGIPVPALPGARQLTETRRKGARPAAGRATASVKSWVQKSFFASRLAPRAEYGCTTAIWRHANGRGAALAPVRRHGCCCWQEDRGTKSEPATERPAHDSLRHSENNSMLMEPSTDCEECSERFRASRPRDPGTVGRNTGRLESRPTWRLRAGSACCACWRTSEHPPRLRVDSRRCRRLGTGRPRRWR